MGRSTIWLAQEENKRPLNNIVESLTKFYNRNDEITVENEEGYKFGIGELSEEGEYTIGTLLKYSKEHKTTTYIQPTREITEESTKGNPLLADCFFAISGFKVAVEERVPHLGHIMIVKILSKIAEQEGNDEGSEFIFVNSTLAIDDIFKQATSEKIKNIKFKNISENPDPTEENLRKFEEIVKDTNSKDVEFNNPKEGINPESKYVKGGKKLAEENKAEIHIETETSSGQSKVYDTSEARNKVRERIEFKGKDDRLSKIKEVFNRFFFGK